MEGFEKQKKKLIVKLPIKTPTPERKTTIKLRLSPEKDSSKGSGLFGAISNPSNQSSAATLDSNRTSDVAMKENAVSTLPTSNPSDIASKPVPIAQISPSRQAPHSPLAFRGSPEKPQSLPHSIDVGYSGS